MPKVTFTTRVDSSGFALPLSRLLEQLLGCKAYEAQVEDVAGQADPFRYYLSRCIDKLASCVLAFARLEQSACVELELVNKLCAVSALAEAARHEANCQVLASVLRPALEMYLDVLVIRSLGSSEERTEACRAALLHHMISDRRMRLEACDAIYGCRPSIYEAELDWHGDEVRRARQALRDRGVVILHTLKDKYPKLFTAGSPLDRIMLGADPFLALTMPAYKLHFIPQNIPENAATAAFYQEWTGMLLRTLSISVLELLDEPIDQTEHAWLASTSAHFGAPTEPGPQCPTVGDRVMYNWGTGRVIAVEVGSTHGNEVLTVEYEVCFVAGLRSPDRIPRRFTKGVLVGERFVAELQRVLAEQRVGTPDELSQMLFSATREVRIEVWWRFWRCVEAASR